MNGPMPQDTQIPYEVYETVHEPTARRRRWVIRLVAALIVATLLVFGGIALKRALTDKKSPTQTGQSQDQNGQKTNPSTSKTPSPQGSSSDQSKTPSTLNQGPQQNSSLPNTGPGPEPAKIPQSDAKNSGTVRKPE